MLNNAEWLENLNYLDFLRDIGRHFSVNRMLSFESVKSRIDREQSLSFLEFNYMILQAYDFLELNRRYGCLFQMGGSDQWGNIVNGVHVKRFIFIKCIFIQLLQLVLACVLYIFNHLCILLSRISMLASTLAFGYCPLFTYMYLAYINSRN